MKISLLQEGETIQGVSVAQRYQEMIAEACLADKLGFYAWGTSEQHFNPPKFTVSAPEVLYAAIAAQTKDIKLRTMCAVMLQWNHPILVAERTSTLDIVSNGRAEIATARSNNLVTLEAFGVDPSTTRAQWEDGMEVLVKAFADETLQHEGPIWNIPPRTIVPRPLQTPHPPIYVSASSVQTHSNAGERGIGVLSFENYFGFDYLQECIDAYRAGLATNKSTIPRRTEQAGLYVATAFCDTTRARAVDIARNVTTSYFKFIIDLYAPLGKKGSYEYLDGRMLRLLEHEGDMDFLISETPSVMVGDPDDFIKRIRQLEQMGIDEILLRIDGIPHEDIMRSIELIGREVMPVINGGGK